MARFFPLLMVCALTVSGELVPKCCDKNAGVREINATLECSNMNETRLQVWSSSYNYLNQSNKGQCVDSVGDTCYQYELASSTIISKIIYPEKYIRKCCPLNHMYNNQSHSCVESDNTTEEFIQSQCVKVGLPHCQLIKDQAFEDPAHAFDRVKDLDADTFCLDQGVNGDYVTRVCQTGLELCENKRCFKKCCPDGQSYVGGAICRDTYVHGLKLDSQGYSPYIEDPDDDYELIYGTGCPSVSLVATNKIQYSIKKRGEFSFYHNFSRKFIEHNYSHLQSYCLEHATKGKIAGYHLFWCMNQKKLEDKFAITLWAKVASCIFLFVTLLVYFYLGETRSTFGKILVNYCMAMILLMITLITSHLSKLPTRLECKIKAYLLIFLNISAFAWVNVMSVDIWWTFGTPRRTIGSDQRKKDLKKFFLYFFYGWGMPLCHSLLILVFDSTTILPESIQPYLGVFKCFFENRNKAKIVWFLVPQLIFQVINTILFIKTAVYCIRVKNEIRKMNDSSGGKENGKFTVDKERLGLIVKLAVIMGIVWISEVTTAFFENMKSYSEFTKNLEIVLDTVTCLQGVFIFLIFICKKKTFNGIKKKLGLSERRISTSMSQSSNVNGHYPMTHRQTTLSMNDSKL